MVAPLPDKPAGIPAGLARNPGAWPLTVLEPVGPVPAPGVPLVPELTGRALPATGFEAPAVSMLVPPTPGTAPARTSVPPVTPGSAPAVRPVTLGAAPAAMPVTVPLTAGSTPPVSPVTVLVAAGRVLAVR